MTVEKLKQYKQLQGEIKDISAEIKELSANKTIDVVKASSTGFPYTEYSSKVYGFDPTTDKKRVALYDKKLLKKAELEKLEAEIEQFIDNINDSRVRRIVEFKYIKGYSWQKVARLIGGNNTGDSCRKAVMRYLVNH